MAASPPRPGRPREPERPRELSAAEIGRAVATGRSSAEQVVADALRRLDEADGWLLAFVEVAAAEALAAARALDGRLARGAPAPPWAGVPIAVKGRGNATELRRLRAAGAIPIGRTAVPRGPGPQTWGHTDRGPTRNPHRPDLSPGGSSAGTAATALRAGNDRRLAALFATTTDLLLTPTTPGPPHGHDGPGDHMSVALTWAFDLSGHPAVSIPAGFTSGGAPVGLQVVAGHRADGRLMNMAVPVIPDS